MKTKTWTKRGGTFAREMGVDSKTRSGHRDRDATSDDLTLWVDGDISGMDCEVGDLQYQTF